MNTLFQRSTLLDYSFLNRHTLLNARSTQKRGHMELQFTSCTARTGLLHVAPRCSRSRHNRHIGGGVPKPNFEGRDPIWSRRWKRVCPGPISLATEQWQTTTEAGKTCASNRPRSNIRALEWAGGIAGESRLSTWRPLATRWSWRLLESFEQDPGGATATLAGPAQRKCCAACS